ncbi:hypothetical protein [Chicken microvirus mg7_19]|nr:hypothetical protein [Chicken microvirus mg7_19]QIR82395.1 hypothetical protein [Chicken microvirus mg8_102]
MPCFSEKVLANKVKAGWTETLDTTPLFVPTGMQRPETSKQTMARLMLESGVISRDDYDKMLGVEFDTSDDGVLSFDFDDDFDVDFDAERFTQTSLAEYEEALDFKNTQSKEDVAQESEAIAQEAIASGARKEDLQNGTENDHKSPDTANASE